VNWPGWLIAVLRFVLGLIGLAGETGGKEQGKAEANVENFKTQADRVAVANEARAAARADTDAGRVSDVDPYRRD